MVNLDKALARYPEKALEKLYIYPTAITCFKPGICRYPGLRFTSLVLYSVFMSTAERENVY